MYNIHMYIYICMSNNKSRKNGDKMNIVLTLNECRIYSNSADI